MTACASPCPVWADGLRHEPASGDSRPVLLLAAHGRRLAETSEPQDDATATGAGPLHQLAAACAASGAFALVLLGWLGRDPALSPDSLPRTAAVTLVCPLLSGRGHFHDVVLPQRLGISGSLTRLDEERVVLLTAPLGEAPALAAALNATAQRCLPPDHQARTTTLLLAGHGSARTTQHLPRSQLALQQHLDELGCWQRVDSACLEQPPLLSDRVPHLAAAGPLLVISLLLNDGFHARNDLARLCPPEVPVLSPLTDPAFVLPLLLDLCRDSLQAGGFCLPEPLRAAHHQPETEPSRHLGKDCR